MIFYFSGTGNSKWIAKELAKTHQESLVSIPEALYAEQTIYALAENEKVGFVFPVYSWGPPPLVLQFIMQVTLSGYQEQYIFFVCTCGDDTGHTKQLFCKAIAARGWNCHAGFSVTMPNTYVLLPGFDVDRHAIERQKLQDAVFTLKTIQRYVTQRQSIFCCNEGRFAFVKSRLIRPLFIKYGMSPNKFRVTPSCISCGRCQTACSVRNITMVMDKPAWGPNCISCLACYHVCPQQAVQYGKRTKGKGQYYFTEAK